MKIDQKQLTLLLSILLSYSAVSSQEINGYAKVTSITGKTITLNNIDESSDSFEDGEQIILMQMQGDVIGNTGNDISFGNLSSISSVGLYEVLTINSHTESSGVPTTITFDENLLNTYRIWKSRLYNCIRYVSKSMEWNHWGCNRI